MTILRQIFKKVLIPCAAGVSALNDGHTYGVNCGKKSEQGTKPSDLPIYSTSCMICKEEARKDSEPPSGIEEAVGSIRRELWVWQDSLKGYRHKIVDVYWKTLSKADDAVDYLREEKHMPQRVGAIGISGLAGYILGMRRGMFRRIFYACCGALGMAAICYPKEAVDYLETVVLEGRKAFIVVYHFIYGESPKMPEWLEKFIGSEAPKALAEEPKPEEKPKANEPVFDLDKILPVDERKEKKS